MNRAIWISIGLLVLILGVIGVYLPSKLPEPEEEVYDPLITIGVVSARWEDHPKYEYLANLAEHDINEYCIENGIDREFEFELACAEGKSKNAYEHVMAFGTMNVTMVTGLPWTTMLCSSRSWGEENGMVLISTGSRGSHLRLEDNCFRLYPFDGFVAKPLVSILQEEGIEDILVLRRKDSWSIDILNEFQPLWESKGGTVYVVEYEPELREEVIMKELEEANEVLVQIIEEGELSSTGVLYLGFSEAGKILEYSSDSTLVSVPWFGTSANVNKTEIIELAGMEARKVSLTSPVPVVAESEMFDQINRGFEEEFGVSLSLENANLYDSLWLLSLTVLEANSTGQDAVSSYLPIVASGYIGLSGPCELDGFGDRVSIQYDVCIAAYRLGRPELRQSVAFFA